MEGGGYLNGGRRIFKWREEDIYHRKSRRWASTGLKKGGDENENLTWREVILH